MSLKIINTNSKTEYLISIVENGVLNNYRGFELNNGIYKYHKVKGKDDDFFVITLISSLIYIDVKYTSENMNVLNVCLYDNDKIKYKIIQPKFLYSSNPNNDAYDWLLNNGLKIYSKFNDLKDFLIHNEEQTEIKQATEETGWQKINNVWEYVGNGFSTADIKYVGQSIAEFETKGDKIYYYSLLEDLFTTHPLLLAIFAYSNSGFLNRFLKEDNNQIMALTGLSSQGKSTALKIALSCWTNPINFLSMNATQIGIKHTTLSYNDNNMLFDETGENTLDKDRIESFLYSLASGKDKLKMQKVGSSFNTVMPKRSYYSFLICGELSIINGLKVKEGISARLCEVFLNDKNTIFNFSDEDDKQSRTQMIELINKELLENYGFLGQDIITEIRNDLSIYGEDFINNKYKHYLYQYRNQFNLTSNIANRKLKILALTATVLDYVIKLVFAQTQMDLNSLQFIFDTSIKALSSSIFDNVSELENKESIYKTVLNDFEDLTQGLFIHKINGIEKMKEDYKFNLKNVYGEIDIDDIKRHKKIYIIASHFDEVCNKLDIDKQLLLSYLKQNNLIEIDKQGKTSKLVSRNGQPKRYYCINIPLSFFDSEEELKQSILDIDPDEEIPFLD